jgi:hypothetical protein
MYFAEPSFGIFEWCEQKVNTTSGEIKHSTISR